MTTLHPFGTTITDATLRQIFALALFDELGLRGQLSASRSQGLSALSEAVLAAARER